MAAAAGKVVRKKKVNGYVMPDPLPSGEILQDLQKKNWKLGKSIGKGGFGEIYSAQEVGSKTADHVVKIVKPPLLINVLVLVTE